MTTPVIIKVATCLRNSREKMTWQEIASIIDEPADYVNKALDKLVAMNVVAPHEGGYAYRSTPGNDRFYLQLLNLYDDVDRELDKSLLLRGILCHLPSKCAFHLTTLLDIAEQEGIDRKEALRLLDEDMAAGYLRRLGVTYTRSGRAGTSRLLPVYIAAYHLWGLRNRGGVRTREYTDLRPDGDRPRPEEEDYLVPQYPANLAGPAMDHLRRDGRQLKDFLEGMDALGWGGWLWRRRRTGDSAGPVGRG